ncbi:AGAP002205-PA-like protein [Anopheles sinensis]|uniref:AGAP002205-PA-like protein n=1 Tax=Anopheles sinensis TaxID=74873 RepID=A0A084VYC5_ANOSI|nr:AGAP002205-PA-like protein [Anopheles sinensis]
MWWLSLLLVGAFLCCVHCWILRANRFARNIPAVKPYVPLIGNVFKVLGTSRKHFFSTLLDDGLRFEKWYKFWLGPIVILFTSHPDIVQAVLTHPDCLKKPFMYDFFNLSNGIIAAPPHVWKSQRKVLNSAFNVRILNSFIPIFVEYSRLMSENLSKIIPDGGQSMYIYPFISKCTLEMVCATTIGCDLLEQPGKEEIVKCIERYV